MVKCWGLEKCWSIGMEPFRTRVFSYFYYFVSNGLSAYGCGVDYLSLEGDGVSSLSAYFFS